MSKFLKIKAKTLQLIDVSTSHGLPALFRTDKLFIKLIWLIAFFVSVCASCYYITNTFLEYFRYETNSKIQVIPEENLSLPVISLCGSHFSQTEKYKNEIQKFLNENLKDNNEINRAYLIAQFEQNFISDSFTDEERKSYFYTKEQFVILCFIYFKNCTNDETIQWYFDRFMGSCWRIGGGDDDRQHIQYEGGKFYGINFIIFPGKFDETNTYGSLGNYGAAVSVNSPDSVPLMNDKMISIPLGFCTNIKIKKIVSKLLPRPYSDCVNPANYINPQFDSGFKYYNRTYSQKLCQQFCKQKNTIDVCNCSSSMFATISKTRYCNSTNELKCIFESLALRDKLKECLTKVCPIECEKTTYETSISFDSFPDHGTIYRMLKQSPIIKEHFADKNLTYELLKSSVARVFIYYDDIEYTLIQETPAREIFDLISNIGG
jgi:hypothetical protein